MTDSRLLALIDDLRQAGEAPTVEFKQDNTDASVVGRLVSAISNTARVQNEEFGYVVWGIRDGDGAVVGTGFEPSAAVRQRQPYEFWLAQRLNPGIAFAFKEASLDNRRIVLLEIPAATRNDRQRPDPPGHDDHRRGSDHRVVSI